MCEHYFENILYTIVFFYKLRLFFCLSIKIIIVEEQYLLQVLSNFLINLTYISIFIIPVEPESLPKEKRKKARQFISFDDDDSVLSSSFPSSSGSVKSETQSTKDNQSLREVPENEIQTMENDTKTKRKLSVENSGVRESFSKTVDGPLTPISPTSVGELTPVSVESPKHLDNVSDDGLEVPTDISAVLTVVENKNKEEIDKLREKIDSLSKENVNLKEQLKTYVSAVQMLKNNEENLEELEIEQQQPDYKYEAKIFEKKLVQVSLNKINK